MLLQPHTKILTAVIFMFLIFPLLSVRAQSTSSPAVRAIDWNSDGSLLAYVASGTWCYDNDEGMTYDIELLDVATNEITKTITGTRCPITSLDWSPDDTQIIAAHNDGQGISIWDTVTGQQGKFGGLVAAFPYQARWKPDGQQIAFSSANGVVTLIDSTTGDILQPNFGGTTLDWNSDGSLLTTGLNYDNTINLVDASTNEFTTLFTNSAPVSTVAWDAADSKIAFGDADGNVQIWNTATNQLESIAIKHPAFLTALHWKPDGTQIVSASLDGALMVWDALTGDKIFTTQIDGGVYSLAWSPHGKQLAYGDGSGLAIIPAPELQATSTNGQASNQLR